MNSSGRGCKPSSFAARDQLKKTLGTLLAVTDDLLHFDNYNCLGRDAQYSNDDVPNTMPVSEPVQSTHVPEHSLLRVCSVFKAQDRIKLNDYTIIVIDSGASGTVCSKRFVLG